MKPRGDVAVLGVDACQGGWVGVLLAPGEAATGLYAAAIAALVDEASRHGPLGVVGVDIPIGIPEIGRRQADVLARRIVGPRRASVFVTPVRAALEADTHALGTSRNTVATGEGMSAQAYGLRRRIFEVDQWRRNASVQLCEVHPEVSFATLAGRPLPSRKSTWAGVETRRVLLASGGVVLPSDLGPAGRASVDDVLDAAIVAWSAHRVALGTALCLPDPPEVLGDGYPCAIWA